MYCRKCGNEIPDGSNYCPNCGEPVNDLNETIPSSQASSSSQATFKEGIIALFNKLFLFEGRSSRSEFNYGFLFLVIISSVLSMFSVSSEISDILLQAELNPELIEQLINEYFASKDLLNSFNLYNIAVSVLIAIFLCAPVFRRLTDCGFTPKIVIVLSILFVMSQIICSTLLWCLLPVDIYLSLGFIFDIMSIVNTVIILICIFKKSA